jgi:hypothetical protein
MVTAAELNNNKHFQNAFFHPVKAHKIAKHFYFSSPTGQHEQQT